MPHSHNIIEAMSVGTIPLIQFGDRFYPPLIDGENAIFFRDLNDLKNKIEYISHLEENEISQLRINVIDYYENNLSPKSFVRKINDLTNSRYELFLNVESISVMEFNGLNETN